MDLVSSIISSTLEKIGELLVQEAFHLSSGVREQVESLQRELRRMQNFLQDADQRLREGDEQVKTLVEDVRVVASGAEDTIEIFELCAERKRRRGRFEKWVYVFSDLAALREICGEIESIKERIGEISSGRSAYSPLLIHGGEWPCSSGKRLQEYRRSAVLAEGEHVVGFEKDAGALMQRLTAGDKCRRVVSIVAMGGAGKTTLAKKLYNRSNVRDHFREKLAWVCVSQTYSVKELLQEVAVQLIPLSKKDSSDLTLEPLQEKLSGFLRDRRYLIVLDDMWEKEAWDQLRPALPDGKNGSRIMLTTRIKDVALYADPGSHPHELPLLSREYSWALFLNVVFPQKNGSCPPNLEDIGKEIVAKCGGLPLAIRVIGGLLSTKEETLRAWRNVLRSLNWQLFQESHCMQILALSYHDLPGYLKPCFLYLGIFPEDVQIPVHKLIWLWIAEGFIQLRGRESKEAAAEDCLEELVNRSMIQVASWDYDGRIVTCCVHDLLREFAISEAQQRRVFEIDGNLQDVSISTALTHVRRLGIHRNHSLYQSGLPNVRSLLCFTNSFPRLLVGGAKWLRVLDLEGVEYPSNELPDVFEALVYLKYLNLDNSIIESFPPSFSKLYYLQTFLVRNARLPAAIWTMHCLRHLVAFECFFDGRPHLRLLKHLHTLALKAGDWIEEESLMELSELRKFRVTGSFVKYRLVLASAINKMVDLESLSLNTKENGFMEVLPQLMPFTHHLSLHSMFLAGILGRLPQSHEFPPNLRQLKLDGCGLRQDPMPTLEKLQNLRILGVCGGICPSKKMIISAQGFPQLRQLCLGPFGIEEWIVERGAMPALKSLQIWGCRELKMLPEGLRYLTTLQQFRIDNISDMSHEFRDRVQPETGADWYKIQHIPHVSIFP